MQLRSLSLFSGVFCVKAAGGQEEENPAEDEGYAADGGDGAQGAKSCYYKEIEAS